MLTKTSRTAQNAFWFERLKALFLLRFIDWITLNKLIFLFQLIALKSVLKAMSVALFNISLPFTGSQYYLEDNLHHKMVNKRNILANIHIFMWTWMLCTFKFVCTLYIYFYIYVCMHGRHFKIIHLLLILIYTC